jgi:hypothetical protein
MRIVGMFLLTGILFAASSIQAQTAMRKTFEHLKLKPHGWSNKTTPLLQSTR